ncbi:protease-associated domain-containing protein [Tenggerimyces flavus]|uniref:Uncharacterized protein n=1 Tax=Tenggerimyces flavus TaxID=1708749 RepID=A0ABV7YCU6_9ACTN|nr:hypothetical protein [Tenggerimyces flavus]MBM7783427.1 hypothetical protein [Tenggerimyces flavus]
MTVASRLVVALTVGSILVGAGVGQAAPAPTLAVKVKLVDRTGNLAKTGSATFQSTNGTYVVAQAGETVQLTGGRYLVVATVESPSPGKLEPSVTMLAQPNLDVRRNQTLTLDARRANRVRFGVDRPDARIFRVAMVSRKNGIQGEEGVELAGTFDDLYAGNVGPVTAGFEFYVRAQLTATDVTVAAPGLDLDVWWLPYQPHLVGKEELKLVDVGAGAPAEIANRGVRGKAVVVTPTEDSDLSATIRAIARNGGRLAIVWFRPGLISGADGRILPTLYTTRAGGAKLVQLAKQGGKISVEGEPASPYRYDLVAPTAGTIPAAPGGTFHDADLARVDARYVNASPFDAVGYTYDNLAISGRQYSFPAGDLSSEEFALPLERTEFSTPGTWYARSSWESVGGPASEDTTGSGYEAIRALQKGKPKSITVGAPVIGPGFGAPFDKVVHPHWVSRDGTDVEAVIPLLADGSGQVDDPDIDQTLTVDKGFTKLFRNGTLVKTINQAGRGGFTIPNGAAKLRIDTELARKAPWWPTSTKITASWTVSSNGSGVLPLMAVRFHPETDLRGEVSAKDAYELPIWIQRERGAPAAEVTKLAVQISYDDGLTWTEAPVTKHPASWTARIATKPQSYVTLRAQATDAAGNTVHQRIYRAFRVRAADPSPSPTPSPKPSPTPTPSPTS